MGSRDEIKLRYCLLENTVGGRCDIITESDHHIESGFPSV